jgi:hypothetical protein
MRTTVTLDERKLSAALEDDEIARELDLRK